MINYPGLYGRMSHSMIFFTAMGTWCNVIKVETNSWFLNVIELGKYGNLLHRT